MGGIMCLIKEEETLLRTASDLNLLTMTRMMILNLVKLIKKNFLLIFFHQKKDHSVNLIKETLSIKENEKALKTSHYFH